MKSILSLVPLAAVLVLSGCTAREDVDKYPYRPTHILSGVGDIPAGDWRTASGTLLTRFKRTSPYPHRSEG